MRKEEKKHIENFLKNTVKRLEQLNSKSYLTLAERYEKDACIGDIKRAEKALKSSN